MRHALFILLAWILSGPHASCQSIDSRWRLLPDSTVAGVTYSQLATIAGLRRESDTDRRRKARAVASLKSENTALRDGAYSDSLALARCLKDAAQGWESSGNYQAQLIQCQGQLKESRRVTAGGVILRILVLSLAAKGGHEIYKEVRP